MNPHSEDLVNINPSLIMKSVTKFNTFANISNSFWGAKLKPTNNASGTLFDVDSNYANSINTLEKNIKNINNITKINEDFISLKEFSIGEMNINSPGN